MAYLEDNQEALSVLEHLLEDVKDSVLHSIALHEANSESRYGVIVELLKRSNVLDRPQLKIRQVGEIREGLTSVGIGTYLVTILRYPVDRARRTFSLVRRRQIGGIRSRHPT